MSSRPSIFSWLGFARAETPPVGIMPPTRPTSLASVSSDRALTLSTVYRGIQIHATATCQLSMGVWRGDVQLERTPAIVTTPDLSESRSAFYEYTVISLYTDGNAFWRLIRAGVDARMPGEIVDIKPLNPREVTVLVDRETDKITYSYRGQTLTPRDIRHLKLMRVPGLDRGLGPIQAAQVELRGAIEARDYGSLWLSESGTPAGILSTDQVLDPAQAKVYKNIWHGRTPDGTANDDAVPLHEIKVLGQGLNYSPLLLKPSEVQFLETQQFTTTQIARLLGVPASLLLAAVEGKSQTYSNIEQEWIAYIRFTLMKALREMEEAMTGLLPHGQVARFKIDALLRTDTKTRYEAHEVGIRAGFLTVNEARAHEGLLPLSADELAELAARPTKEAANARV